MSSSPSSSSSSAAPAPGPFGILDDVSCRVSVLLGSGSITVGECLALRRNSVVRLKQAAGDDLCVSVHGVVIARGEVTIVDDSTAIRLTDITAPGAYEVR